MSLDALNEDLAKPRGKWAKLLNVGDKVTGVLVDGEMVDRTDPEGNIVKNKKTDLPRRVYRLWLQTDEREDGDDDGIRIFDANESAQSALRAILPLERGQTIAIAVTKAAADKFSQLTYKAQSKPAPIQQPAASVDDEDLF